MRQLPAFGALVARLALRWPSSFQSSYLETFPFSFPRTFIPGDTVNGRCLIFRPSFCGRRRLPGILLASFPGNRNFLDPLRGPQLRAARPRITIDLFFCGGLPLTCPYLVEYPILSRTP